jgi:NAD(P)-dependent dehydrogenase (short-subunit alcohol dehydrogenase family)
MNAGRALAQLGHIDILINNAGASWGAPAEDHPVAAWDKVMDLNIRSIFLVSQLVGKRSMIPRGTAASSTSPRLPAGRQSAGHHADHRLQHLERRGGQLHPHAGRRMGPPASPSMRWRRASSRPR